jgi:HlyD family secretion protein
VSRSLLLLCCLCFLPLTLAACAASEDLPTVLAERGDLPLVTVESGEVQAVRSQQVRPPQEWDGDLIIVRMVPEGTLVAAGDTVIWLDPSNLERRLLAAQDRLTTLQTQRTGVVANQRAQRQALVSRVETAQLSRQQAELQQEKLRFESESRRQESRWTLLSAEVSLEEARTKLTAQAVLDSLELAKTDLEIATAEAVRDDLRERIAAMAIRAPLDGMVVYLERRDREGRRSKPRVGDAIDTWQPIVAIPDLSRMQVEFFVHEVDRHRYADGQPVTVRLEAYPETVFGGEITSIALLATAHEQGDDVRGFLAQAQLAQSDPRLRPGMSAIVAVDLGLVTDVVLIPRQAIVELDGQAVVFPRATWPQPLVVELSALSPRLAAVATGLSAGLELVVPWPQRPAGTEPLGALRHLQKESS